MTAIIKIIIVVIMAERQVASRIHFHHEFCLLIFLENMHIFSTSVVAECSSSRSSRFSFFFFFLLLLLHLLIFLCLLTCLNCAT